MLLFSYCFYKDHLSHSKSKKNKISMNIEALPTLLLLHSFRRLNFKDLLQLTTVNKFMYNLCKQFMSRNFKVNKLSYEKFIVDMLKTNTCSNIQSIIWRMGTIGRNEVLIVAKVLKASYNISFLHLEHKDDAIWNLEPKKCKPISMTKICNSISQMKRLKKLVLHRIDLRFFSTVMPSVTCFSIKEVLFFNIKGARFNISTIFPNLKFFKAINNSFSSITIQDCRFLRKIVFKYCLQGAESYFGNNMEILENVKTLKIHGQNPFSVKRIFCHLKNLEKLTCCAYDVFNDITPTMIYTLKTLHVDYVNSTEICQITQILPNLLHFKACLKYKSHFIRINLVKKSESIDDQLCRIIEKVIKKYGT